MGERMRSQFQYTVTLGRLGELPSVLASYRAHRAQIKSIQDARILQTITILLRQVLDEINTVEIPVSVGRRELVLFEGSSDAVEIDSIWITKHGVQAGATRPDDGVRLVTSILTGKDDNEDDFDAASEITARMYRLLYEQLRRTLKAEYPEGNVKVASKRERTRRITSEPDQDGNTTTEELVYPRHLVVSVGIPASLLRPPPKPTPRRPRPKSPARKRKARKADHGR